MDNLITISEINITPVKPDNGLVGFVSFVVNECLYVSSVAIVTKLDGSIRLVYPTKLVNDKQVSLIHPINKSVGSLIEQQVSEIYEEVMNGVTNVRYTSVKS